MREKWAKRIALLTGVIVMLLAGLFALFQNPINSPTEIADTSGIRPKNDDIEQQKLSVSHLMQIEAGRQVYQQHGCAQCHSIRGEGNPRNPLDGVGIKRTDEELHDWITGTDAIQGLVSSGVFKLKNVNKGMPAQDLDALLIYLKSLR